MRRKIILTFILLAACAACAALALRRAAPSEERPTPPVESSSPVPTQCPSPQPAEKAAPPEATEEPLPEERRWTLSFAGDCTIGTLHEWRGSGHNGNMLYRIGENYDLPFSQVKAYFASDDFTLVNFEGTLTEAGNPVGKDYRFSAPQRYAKVLVEGGVDAVSLANNHSVDYREAGKADTVEALQAHEILYGDVTAPIMTELSGGLRLGVITYNTVETQHAVGDLQAYRAELEPLYSACAEAGCDVILAFVHWGWEYRYQPEQWMVELGHWLVDLGCDMVVAGHAHVLQPMEYYQDAPIFYSLGNFCYGGHSNPEDKDCALVQQEIVRAPDGSISLGALKIVPCSISGDEHSNDFCPTPYEEGSAGYQRVLDKMNVAAADGSAK